MRRRRAVILLAVLLGGCDVPMEPLPAGAVAIVPAAPYAMWWKRTEECAGRRGDFADVRWYVVPGVSEFLVDGSPYHGYWWPQGNRIVLAEGSMFSGPLVRHEMLHAITREGGHSREDFVTRCGGIVTCLGECETAVGADPVPPADAPELAPSELLVALRLVPTDISWSADSGWFTVTVTATNPRAEPVWVRLTSTDPDYPVWATFGYIIGLQGDTWGSAEGGYEWTEESRMPFAAGQTRRLMFDFSFLPGDYDIRGFFNSDTTAAQALTIRP